MKIFVFVIIAATIIGGFVGGELMEVMFSLTGAVIGGLGTFTILMSLGAYFDAQDRRNPKIELTPEIRKVFDRLIGKGAAVHPARAHKDSETKAVLTPGEVLNIKGTDLARQGQFQEAVLILGKAIVIEPDYAEPYYNRGKAKLNLGDYSGAIADLDSAIGLDPQNADSYNNRAIAKKKAGLLVEAVSDYTTALQLDPMLFQTYLNRGIAYYELGNTVAACSDFTVARNHNVPNSEEAMRQAGCF